MKLQHSVLTLTALFTASIIAAPTDSSLQTPWHDHEDRDINCNQAAAGTFPLRWDDCERAIDQFGLDYPHPGNERRDRWVVYYNDPRPEPTDWPAHYPPPRYLKLPHTEIKGTCNFTIDRINSQPRPYDLEWLWIHDGDGEAVIGYCRDKSDHGGECTQFWGAWTSRAYFNPFIPVGPDSWTE